MSQAVGYRRSFWQSIVLHLGLMLVFSVSVVSSGNHYVLEESDNDDGEIDIIRAVSIDQTKIEQEMVAIQKERDAQRAAEQARQQQLTQEAEQAKAQRQAEEKRLAELQRQTEQQLQEQRERASVAERELAQLQEQRSAEQERLLAVEAERELLELERQREQEAEQRAQRARIQGEVDRYRALILSAIEQEWIFPGNVDPSLSARFEIRLGPDGSILSVRLLQSSGNGALDRSAETAIYQAAPLPVPSDEEAFREFEVLNLTVRPESLS